MAQLRQHLAEFESLNTRIVLISFSRPDQARYWLNETDAPFTLLLDPERKAYRAYGLEYSLLRSWAPKVWLMYAQLIQDDSGQLGGDVIVDSRGCIRLFHRSHDPTDRPAIHVLLTALR